MFQTILTKLGLDSTAFERGMVGAEKRVGKFSSMLGRIGLGAFGLTAVVGMFRSVMDNARNAEGELDKNTAAVKRFAEGVDSLKGVAVSAGTAIVGTFNRVGEGFAYTVGVLWHGEQAVRAMEAANRSANKFMETHAERMLELTERMQTADENLARARQEQQKAEHDALKTTEKIAIVDARRQELLKEQQGLERGGIRFKEIEAKLIEDLLELDRLRAQHARESTRAADDAIAARQRAGNQQDQADALARRNAEMLQREEERIQSMVERFNERQHDFQMSQVSTTERLQDIEERILRTRERIADADMAGDVEESVKQAERLLSLQQQSLFERQKEKDEAQEIANIQERLQRAQENLLAARQRMAAPITAGDGEKLTIAQLADGRGDPRQRRLAEAAQRAARDEDRARAALESAGTPAERAAAIRRGEAARRRGLAARDRLGDVLTPEDRDPIRFAREQVEEAKSAVKVLEDLLEEMRNITQPPSNT